MVNNIEKNKVINIDINEQNVYADYGYDGQLLVEETLVDKMEFLASSRPIKENLTFCFRRKYNIAVDEQKFVDAYHNTMNNYVKAKQHEIGRCLLTGIIMLIISAILICVENFWLINMGAIVSEVSNVASWVFAWAAIEILAIQLIQLVIDKRKVQRLRDAKIIFEEDVTE